MKEEKILKRGTVALIAGGTIALSLLIAWIINLWWLPLPIIIISYFFGHEFFPIVSIKEAKKIIGDKIIESKPERIPTSLFFLRKISKQNRKLQKENKGYQIFLTTCPRFIKENYRGNEIKIAGKNCFFFFKKMEGSQPCPEIYSMGKGSQDENKEERIMEEVMEN